MERRLMPSISGFGPRPLHIRTLLLAVVLPLLLAGSPSAAIITAENKTAALYTCLRDAGFGEFAISLPDTPSFTLALSQSLIQDALAAPQIFVRPAGTGQVAEAVICARDIGVVFCARSGGHSWSSSSLCPGLVIDLQRVNFLRADASRNVVSIGAGNTIGETLYQLYTTTGHIIPTGTCPSVGVGGYIQGGGLGTLAGELGLLADNVQAMTVVTPDGRIVRANRNKNFKDLFWGLAGGGGGYFGVVTSFTLRTYDAAGTYDNNVYFGFTWDDQHAAEALYQWTKYPPATDGSVYLRMVPLTSRQGLRVRGVGICWKVLSKKECRAKLNALALWRVPGRTRDIMRVSTEGALEAQKYFTSDGQFANARPGGPETTQATFSQRFVTKGFLSDKAWGSVVWDESMMESSTEYFQAMLDLMIDARETSDMRGIAIEFYPLGRRVNELPRNFSSFPHRGALAMLAVFYNGGTTTARLAAKSRIQNFLRPYSTGVYVNYQDVDLPAGEYQREYWGASLARLQNIKRRFDPNQRMWHPQPL